MPNFQADISRREFLRLSGLGLGTAGLATLLPQSLQALTNAKLPSQLKGSPQKAKRVIYLSMVGGPSQLDLFDHKPKLQERAGEDLSAELPLPKHGFPAMTADQVTKEIAPSAFQFSKQGESATWISELLPHTAKIVDDLAIIKSMHTDAIDHDTAKQIAHTGSPTLGHPSLGAWLSYALGSQNEALPNFAVLHSQHSTMAKVGTLASRLWGAGFLSGDHAGVPFQSKDGAIAYLNDLPGIDRELRRQMLDSLNDLNQKNFDKVGSDAIKMRIAQYERSYQMQEGVAELNDLSNEAAIARAMYGPQANQAGSFAHSCLMARRMVERGVQFVQIFHRGWDHHENLPTHLKTQCADIDQPCWALIADLKQRGLLDDTLVVWGGEFGRSVYSQGKFNAQNYGRDHQAQAYTMWMAGGGIKGGQSYGETDELGTSIVKDPVHITDLRATILNQLGLNPQELSSAPAKVITGILK